MTFCIYSIFDRITGLYGDPFVAVNVGSAVRSFKRICMNNIATPDLALFQLGDFDTETGHITSKVEPELIINGAEVTYE